MTGAGDIGKLVVQGDGVSWAIDYATPVLPQDSVRKTIDHALRDGALPPGEYRVTRAADGGVSFAPRDDRGA